MRYSPPSPPPTTSVRPSGDQASAVGKSSTGTTGPAASTALAPLMTTSGDAAQEAGQQFLAVQLAPDEHQLAGARRLAPGTLRTAVEHHVHAVEDVAALVTLDVQHALHAQDVLAMRLQQPGQPVVHLACIERARLLDADGTDLGIMVMRGEGQ